MPKLVRISCIIILFLSSCRTARNAGDDGLIEAVFLQVNDVYEIAPLSAGKEGGIARLATIKKSYLSKNPNTFLVMAGDFLSPSVYHSLIYEGKPVRGKQMVEALNVAGLDLATFGNHEFDIRENELQERMDESSFKWISSNTFHKTGERIRPFVQKGKAIPKTLVIHTRDADGTHAKIGVITATLPFNMADYVHYDEGLETAKELYNLIKDSVDVVIALTHQSIDEDIRMAKEIPGLAMIMGGHEHDNRFVKQGRVYITKAHANAKSVYALHLKMDLNRNKYELVPVLVYLNEEVALDSATNVVVKKWSSIAENNFTAQGFDAGRVILNSYKGEPLDGRETEVRRQATGLTRLIIKGIEHAAPQSVVAIMNGGSIRVDDELHAPLTEYDILRTLPFGGGITEADIKGSLLVQVLEQGMKNSGTGGFLHFSHSALKRGGQWYINNNPVEPGKTYRVAFTEFLLTGKESNLAYLNPENPLVEKIYPAPPLSDLRSDLRLALINYISSLNTEK